MKRKLAIMMAICLVAGAFNGTMGMPIVEAAEVQQETENNGDYTYNYWTSNSIEITGYTGRETELVIPSEIDGKTVTRIGESAFEGCSGLTSIEIPSSVTKIAYSAFKGCRGLTSIEIPSASIDNYAFYDCSGLTSIEISSNVTSIGNSTFGGCSGLASIEIPSSVTKIGEFAFEGCSGLTSIKIPSGVASIGRSAFKGCSGLTSIEVEEGNQWYDSRENCNAIIGKESNELIAGCKRTIIPSGVTSIGDDSFAGCLDLASIKIPSSVTNIGYYAFEGCSRLASIEIPSGVASISDGAFKDCSGLTSIEVEEGNQWYDSRGNCNAIIEKESNELIAGCKKTIIPSGVASIGDSAFYGCSDLISIEIPSSVVSIGNSAFGDCSRLTSIEIPSSVASIGGYAFYDCSNLTSIEIPLSVTNIGYSAFYGCSGVTIYCSQGSYAEQYAKENNFAIQYISGTPDQNPTEKPGSGDTEEPGKEPSENPGTETPGTPDQNPTEKPGSGNTEEPGKEPSENPGNQPSGTPDQNPTETPGNGSTEKPAVSPDGKIIQTITAEDIVKTMGDEPFYLDAETDGDGTLTYESKNPDIVKVDGTGKATIVSAGTVKISVTASATDTYSSAEKTVTVTVIPEGYTPIEDIDDLYAIRNDPDGNYILVNDIDMSATQKGGDYDCGTGWDSIEEFSGTLDGNGHRIVGMHIFGEYTSEANIGLFEKSSGSIINLGMVDCDIDVAIMAENREPMYVGTISGSGGNIENCYSSGKIEIWGNLTYDSACVGGLIGLSGKFKNCYNTCEITCAQTESNGAISYIGGICGYDHYGEEDKCYNIGNIKGSGEARVGAICGYVAFDGYRVNYLKGTAQQGMGTKADNPNCVALTETQMKNPKLFTGFDFANTWEVDPYCSYPYPQLKNNRMVRINGIRLDTAPTKLTYNQGEALKLDGAALEISYEDGINTTIPLEKDMLSGYDMNKIGQQTVTVSYGGGETSFDIEVREVQVSGISIPKTLSLDRSKQKQLSASITPANASDKSVTWESDNPGVASVNSNGLVKAKAKGKAVITATASNGVKASCTVTVLVPAVSVKLSQSSLSMAAGSQRSIKAQVLPLESTDSVSWKSSNKAVAEVYDGSILAKKEGTAKITAYTKSGAKASCTVTVKKSGNGASSEIKKITSKKAKIKSAKNVKKKSIKLKLSGSVNGSGYKIQYGTSRKFKGAKTVTAKGGTATIKKLKAKKTYYIRARIYKKISGRTYYGKWSSVKSVKIKK